MTLSQLKISDVNLNSTQPLQSGRMLSPSSRTITGKHPYPQRRFLWLDGEGVNHPELSAQSLVLFGDSDGNHIRGYDLRTEALLDFITALHRKHPHAIYVSFAFTYDVNMIVSDIPVDKLTQLQHGETVCWSRYKLTWLVNKWLEVTDRRHGNTIRIYDTFTFFACSFIKACQQYLPNDPDVAIVAKGKALRNVFEYSELDTVIYPYWKLEGELGVKLVNALRRSLATAGIIPKSWHGPGAVATALLVTNKIKQHKSVNDDPEVIAASQYAYYGGRFEQFHTGYYNGDIYGYDIRSAYPYALTHVPSLCGEWSKRRHPTGNTHYVLYHIRYARQQFDVTKPNPIPLRGKRHEVYYPPINDTWIWGPEYEAASKWFDNIRYDWVLEYNDTGERPFEFIHDMYRQRAQWKRDGNPAQLAAKLGMNSIYGKLAQRVGWDEDKRTAPPWHQLDWAGFVTSYCRAMMLDVMMQAPEHIIAIETDGIYSTVPLNVPIGTELGEYETERYSGIVYVQSGVYFTRDMNNQWSAGKSRGFKNNTLPIKKVLGSVRTLHPMTTKQTRFGGMALHKSKPSWRRFNEEQHIVGWGGNGKRYHEATDCTACNDSDRNTWHNTRVRIPDTMTSYPHTLPWKDEAHNDYQENADDRYTNNLEVFA